MKIGLLSCVGVSVLLLGCGRADVEQASREFNQLPPDVQRTVRSTAPQAEIADVGESERNGRRVYRIAFRDSQRHPPMEVAADGQTVRYEAGTTAMGSADLDDDEGRRVGGGSSSLSALPPGVQRAIQESAPRAQVMDIRRIEENGRVVYEVEYAGSKPRPTLQVVEDGTILKKPADTAARPHRDD